MARVFHLSSYNPLRVGADSYVLDDSPTLGRNRKEYSKLEDALGVVKSYGREKNLVLMVHHLRDDDREIVQKRLSAFPRVKVEEHK